MSSGNQQHFTSTDMDMLNRILERAGIGDFLDFSGRRIRMKAARFLIETFQQGVTSESALYFALLSRPAELSESSLADAGAPPIRIARTSTGTRLR